MSTRPVLAAIDFSPTSVAALEFAIAVAKKRGAPVHVVHAYAIPIVPLAEGGALLTDDFDHQVRAALERDLGQLVAAHRTHVEMEWHLVHGPPVEALLREARRLGAGLVVLGTHGRSGFTRFVLGSVAERLARACPVSVLVVPPREAGPRSVRSILCGVDFSVGADVALRAALELAAEQGATLHVAHVWDAGLHGASDVRARAESDLRRELESLVGRHPMPGLVVQRHLATGVPYVALVELGRSLAADMIVVGTHGKSALEHFLMGSVAERVLRGSPVPVLVARQER